MPQSAAFTYDDPMPYQAAIRGGEAEVSVTARGDFRGKLIKIDLYNLWMQSGRENLPRVIRASVSPIRTGIQFLADAGQPALQHTGLELHTRAIAELQPGSTYRFRSRSPCRWATMSLTPAAIALFGLAIAACPRPAATSPLTSSVRALLSYNTLATIYLLYVRIGGLLTGILLWPAIVLHAIFSILLGRAGSPREISRQEKISRLVIEADLEGNSSLGQVPRDKRKVTCTRRLVYWCWQAR